MDDLKKLEFFVLRYVLDAVKDEAINVGIVMFESGKSGEFADVRFMQDWRRLLRCDPQADIEMLEALEHDLRSRLSVTDEREALLRRVNDSFSNLIQVSSTKACLALDPVKEIEILASLYLEGAQKSTQTTLSERQRLIKRMQGAFEQAGVWTSLLKNIPAAPYTKAGDPFKFDFGYRVGAEIKLFHAVPLKTNVEHAVMLAARYPRMAQGITQTAQAHPSLIAVIEDDVDRQQDEVRFALGALEEEKIRVAAITEMPSIADRVRVDLRA
jgi:hypothetical protein